MILLETIVKEYYCILLYRDVKKIHIYNSTVLTTSLSFTEIKRVEQSEFEKGKRVYRGKETVSLMMKEVTSYTVCMCVSHTYI